MRLIRLAIVFCVLAAAASAVPLTRALSGVRFDDGGTLSGSFTFDADAGTACSTGASPCGVYSNVHITTTAGATRTVGATYAFVCGGPTTTISVAGCTGATPDSTVVVLLTSNTNLAGSPGLALFFTGTGLTPPAGLSDNVVAIDISNSSAAVGAAQEASCADAACSFPVAPSRLSVAGTEVTLAVPATPTLSEWGMIAFGIMLTAYAAFRLRTVSV